MKQKSLEIRNSKFGKIRFFTEFEKWHSDSEFEEQNSAVCSNIRQHSPTSSSLCSHCSLLTFLLFTFYKLIGRTNSSNPKFVAVVQCITQSPYWRARRWITIIEQLTTKSTEPQSPHPWTPAEKFLISSRGTTRARLMSISAGGSAGKMRLSMFG